MVSECVPLSEAPDVPGLDDLLRRPHLLKSLASPSLPCARCIAPAVYDAELQQDQSSKRLRLKGAAATRSVSQAGYGQYGWFGHALFRLVLTLMLVSACQ